MALSWDIYYMAASDIVTARREERRERSRNPRKYVDGCKTCEDIKAHDGFGPSHDASYGCESGWYEHCSCDTCF